MSEVFASSDSQVEPVAASMVTNPTDVSRQPELSQSVGQAAHGTLTADQREASIKLAGLLVERHMRLANEDPANYFLHRGNADRARLSMEALIKGRDADWKRTEQQDKGLV